MNRTMLNVDFAMNRCKRFTRQCQQSFVVLVSILRISKTTRRSEQDLYGMSFTRPVHSSARSHQGFRARLKGLARAVAVVIGLSLSIASMPRLEASIDATKALANYQLTDKQYKCHNQIIYLESRWVIDAIGNKSGSKQTYGYYQIKSDHIKGKPYDYQFWMYWHYVSKRYGTTEYDEPNYCNALNHLKRKGWQ
jgi:hypothetical protein